MTYQELEKLYPNKEIKMISENYKQTYLNFGFKIIDSFIQVHPCSKEENTYYFMVE